MSALPSTIKFALIAAATNNSASSRLRCIGLAREIRKLGYIAEVSNVPSPEANVLLIQKIVTARILTIAQDFKGKGGLVIYDIDDHGDLALGSLRPSNDIFEAFLACVSIVLVDTETRKINIERDRQYQHISNFWVIPDPVDYIEEMNEYTPPQNEKWVEKYRGCWFGNAPNIIPAVPYLLVADKCTNVASLDVITNQDYVESIQKKFPSFFTTAWTLSSFPDLLKSMHFCILIHDSTIEGVQKSNNKMLAALVMGVVPFVSRTPAYLETAIELSLPELVIDKPEDLLDRLKPEVFNVIQKKISSQSCWELLKRYSPSHSAIFFLEKLGEFFKTNQVPINCPMPVKINLGSGGSPLKGYINVDATPTRLGITPDIICDIRNLSIFDDNYADEIIAIHVIEHFWRWEVLDILKEWLRVLKPEGKLILECPNLISACKEILANPDATTGPGPEGQRTMWCLYGDPVHQDPLMCHRWLYTPQSLGQLLRESGLIDVINEPAVFKLREPRDMRITGIKPGVSSVLNRDTNTKFRITNNISSIQKTVPAKTGLPKQRSILIICRDFWPSTGGVESRMLQLSFELVSFGYQVEVLTLENASRTKDVLDGVRIKSISRVEFSSAIKRSVESGIYHACIVVQDPLGNIIWSLENSIPPSSTRLIIQPIINEDGYNRWRDNIDFKSRLANILKIASTPLVMTKSGPDKRFMTEARIKHAYLPNATRPIEAAGDFRAKFGILETDFLILHVANLYWVKNHLGLMHALSELPSSCRLVMIGNASGELECAEAVSENLKSRPDIIFIPGLASDWISAAMQAADIVVLSSKGEGSPNVILEAMSHGKTWLATPECGAANDHLGGFICELDYFKDHINLIYENPEIKDELGKISFLHWEQCYSWEIVFSGWIDIIESGSLSRQFEPTISLLERMQSAQMKLQKLILMNH
jgi:glycosyltransferase involved in cell wall biosynthesis